MSERVRIKKVYRYVVTVTGLELPDTVWDDDVDAARNRADDVADCHDDQTQILVTRVPVGKPERKVILRLQGKKNV